MLDTEWLHGEADDTVFLDFGLDCVIHDSDIDVVVNVCYLDVRGDKANQESLPITRGDTHVVFFLARG
jgi:hypothetical protein